MGSRKLILVLDDDPSVLRAVERLLKAHGFDAEAFLTIDSFIERAHLRAAICLVLDINLNGSSGIDLKRKLNDARIALPVIFITARDEEVTRRAALSAGCVAYLSKPFSSKDLVEAIEASQDPDRAAPVEDIASRSLRLGTIAQAFRNRSPCLG
jgi:FixJ family two-component response regulator